MNEDILSKQNDNLLVKHDLTAWFTIFIVANFVISKIKNIKSFDNEWIYYMLASLFGLCIHSLITSKGTLYLIRKFNIKKYNVKLALADVIKWGTVYIINNALFTYFKDGNVEYTNEWLKIYGGIIIGYVLFDLLLYQKIYNLHNTKPSNIKEPQSEINKIEFMVDAFKIAVGLFVGYYLNHGYVHTDYIHIATSIEIGLIVYYLIVLNNIPTILL
jgi:biotin transporter BioY